MNTNETHIALPDRIDRALVTGPNDSFLRTVEAIFDVQISLHGDEFVVRGQRKTELAAKLLTDIIGQVMAKDEPTLEDVKCCAKLICHSDYPPASLRDDVLLSYHGHVIRPKTCGQKRYVDAIRENIVTFAIGPAGTGKTYLAMAMAVAALNDKKVGRIVLTRPIVEAGENLGFLPGTLTEKVDPYMRPFYDALFEMTDSETIHKLIDDCVIEISPLAFMRGRTFNDTFLVLDEAQNSTPEQMKMFLTRLGIGSKMVVTGDITQSDLSGAVSGLRDAREVLEGLDGISFCDFDRSDVIRHSLVARIIKAYERGRQKK